MRPVSSKAQKHLGAGKGCACACSVFRVQRSKEKIMLHTKSLFVKDIHEKDQIHSVFLVKFSAVAVGKTGKPYMNVVLMDKTGEIDARIWSDVNQYAGQIVNDAFVAVEGRCQLYQNKRQLVIDLIEVVREDEINLGDFLVEAKIDAKVLYGKLLGYVESMQDPHYKALALAILRDDADVVDRIQRAPAAKSVHHAYPVGLLEHVISITGILDHLAVHYSPGVDRDLLFMGGFLHDIGKLWELSYDRLTEYTDAGRLIGHLVMGTELIDQKIRLLEATPGKIPGDKFPEDKRLHLKHVILAHHGELEYGSPKRPKSIEALIVHYVDDLDSKVNTIRSFIEQDQTPGKWTAYHRGLERYFLKLVSVEKPTDSTR